MGKSNYMNKQHNEYAAQHKEVNKERGPAYRHNCVDCGKQAIEWSQIHGSDGWDPDNFEPRCIPCHRTYDADSLRLKDVGKIPPAFP